MFLKQEMKKIQETKNRLTTCCDLRRQLVHIEVHAIWSGKFSTASNLTLDEGSKGWKKITDGTARRGIAHCYRFDMLGIFRSDEDLGGIHLGELAHILGAPPETPD